MSGKIYQPHVTIKEKTTTTSAKFLRLLTEDDLPQINPEVDKDIYVLLQTLNDEIL